MVPEENLILPDASLVEALSKIERNQNGFIVCVDTNHVCLGVLTDGDARRCLIQQSHKALADISVADAMNRNFQFRYIGQHESDLDHKKIKFLPILDRNKRLLKIDNLDGSFWIGDRHISGSSMPFIIGEIGNNHNGDFELAKELVLALHQAGADSAKFQMRNMEALYSRDNGSDDLATEYTKDLLSKFQLSQENLLYLFEFTKDLGMIPICTPWDEESLSVLQEANMMAYKIASADMTNFQLIKKVIQTGRPLICSTGMSEEDEILQLIDFLNKNNAEYALLHCNSTYPTPFSHINLNYIHRLKTLTQAPIGYSGHERDVFVSVAACAMGAKIIERHITFDKNMEGADHKASLLPDEFKRMIEGIEQINESLGSQNPRYMTQAEMINRHNLSKSLTTNREIKSGDRLQREYVTLRSPGTGIRPTELDNYVGRIVTSDLTKGTMLLPKHFTQPQREKLKFATENRLGIPVRYHDCISLANLASFNFVEFHLTYKDLLIDPNDYLEGMTLDYFTVHAPELFANDHLLNLASGDKIYRQTSIDNFNRTLDAVLKLKDIFNFRGRVPLVVNCGGFSKNGFMDQSEKSKSTEILYETVGDLDKSEIIFCAQTMPPFPWHFGGQQFHNLLRTPQEIMEFCEVTGERICLDTSHTMMSSKYFGFEFIESLKTLSSHVEHIHLADSSGVDEEGVFLGCGDLPLQQLHTFIEKYCSQASIILETWQGHHNEGENFIKDLNTWLDVVNAY